MILVGAGSMVQDSDTLLKNPLISLKELESATILFYLTERE